MLEFLALPAVAIAAALFPERKMKDKEKKSKDQRKAQEYLEDFDLAAG